MSPEQIEEVKSFLIGTFTDDDHWDLDDNKEQKRFYRDLNVGKFRDITLFHRKPTVQEITLLEKLLSAFDVSDYEELGRIGAHEMAKKLEEKERTEKKVAVKPTEDDPNNDENDDDFDSMLDDLLRKMDEDEDKDDSSPKGRRKTSGFTFPSLLSDGVMPTPFALASKRANPRTLDDFIKAVTGVLSSYGHFKVKTEKSDNSCTFTLTSIKGAKEYVWCGQYVGGLRPKFFLNDNFECMKKQSLAQSYSFISFRNPYRDLQLHTVAKDGKPGYLVGVCLNPIDTRDSVRHLYDFFKCCVG